MLEAVCYVALSTLIVFFLMQCIVTTTLSLKKVCTSNAAFCQLFAAHHLLEFDLQSAPQSLRDWKLISDSALVWKGAQIDRGWLFEKNKVSRIHGTYNASEQKWTKKVKHIVARGIDRLQFTVQKHGSENSDMRSVQYTLATQAASYTLDHTVMIQNRKL